jgi:hypothetical protein
MRSAFGHVLPNPLPLPAEAGSAVVPRYGNTAAFLHNDFRHLKPKNAYLKAI